MRTRAGADFWETDAPPSGA